MRIVVLGGSPKGEKSVTLQYVRYAAKKHPDHTFQIFHIARTIARLEKDEAAFGEVMDAVRGADAVLWAFPLCFLLVCSQYKRFIELIFARHQESAFAGKYAASFSTSIHFFDHTAHEYIHAICDDLWMRTFGAYSAAMYDLMKKPERTRWLAFIERLIDQTARQAVTASWFLPLTSPSSTYEPGPVIKGMVNPKLNVLILKDGGPLAGNTDAMVQAMAHYGGQARVVADIGIKGGCLGCCRCGLDNVCQYQGKDGYIPFYEETVKKADCVVFAGAIRDRYPRDGFGADGVSLPGCFTRKYF